MPSIRHADSSGIAPLWRRVLLISGREQGEGVAHRKTLNERQLAVLKWISDGCPDGPISGISARISAGALRNRGLVKVSGGGPTWTAVITGTGRDELARAAGPRAPVPRQANESVTEALVKQVIDAGGSLRLPRQPYHRAGTPDYQRRAELAERYGRVPSGKRLVVTVISRDELEIDLVDAPEGTCRTPEAVPVPQRVTRFHPVVTEFRDRAQRQTIVSGYADRRRTSTWSDRKSGRLEEKLPDLLCEIEIRAAEDRHRRRVAEEQAVERERAWEKAMQRACERHAEHYRPTVLTAQVSAWREAAEIRAYCDAAEGQQGSDATRWIEWARRFADRLDPLRTILSEPNAPTNVKPEELRPFLDGWAPYRPGREC